MKNYLATQESFNELLEKMIECNVFQYAIALKGEKGYEYSDEFRKYFLKTIEIAKATKLKVTQMELFTSTIMTFNEKIPFKLAKQMAYVIGGRNIEAKKKQNYFGIV